MILDRIKSLLRDLFRSNARPPEDEDEAAEVAARLEQKVLKLVGNMPTLPEAATRAIAMANDPDADFAEFARLVEGDAAIASGLLRVANSALYASSSPVVKLHQAVVRLGMAQCKNLILSISLKSLTWNMAGGEKARCEALWQHGHVTAALCRQLNRDYRLGHDGAEYFAGLLHDLGRTLLLLADPACFERVGGLDFREGEDVLRRERAAIGIDHCALGAWFAEHSQLPETMIQAMRHHHDEELGDASGRLVTLVAAADHVANHLQRGEPAGAYDPGENAALARLWARWPEGRRERLVAEAPRLMEEALAVAASEQMVH